MSYTVLARRYRSGTFDELIGQDHVARTLKKAIASGRIAHAYLFCGTRGTGKTSTARILAKCLNCQSADAPTSAPCGTCNSCQAVARGEDIDVIEIDAASNTQVEKTRDAIIENAAYRPARSRFKIYIIDEVHMLSKSSFNALLKTLEEPPEHVKFILATTEPEKVLPTILSRCQRYDFRNIPTREIAGHLKNIVARENVQADDDALLLVAKAGAGSMRDALSLLDRLLSIGEDRLTVETLEQLLGLPKSQLLFELADAVGAGDTGAVLTQADAMITSGLSPDSLVAALVEHLRNLLILRACGPGSDLVEVPGLNPKDLQRQAEQFDPAALTQDIAVLEELRRHMRQSQGGRALLDATLVRMTLADQFASIGELLGRLDGSGPATPSRAMRPASSGVAPRQAASAPAQKKNELADARSAPTLPTPPSTPTPTPGSESAPVRAADVHEHDGADNDDDDDDDDDDLPAPGKVWESGGPSLVELLRQRESAQPPASGPSPAESSSSEVSSEVSSGDSSDVVPVAGRDLPDIWKNLLAALSAHGPALSGLFAHGRLAEVGDDTAVIRWGPQHETFVKLLDRNGKKDLVRNAMSSVLERPMGVTFEVDPAPSVAEAAQTAATRPAPPPTARRPAPPPREPAAPPAPVQRVTPEMVETLRATQPLIKALMDGLGAQIIKVE